MSPSERINLDSTGYDTFNEFDDLDDDDDYDEYNQFKSWSGCTDRHREGRDRRYITCKNTSGLSSTLILNSILPQDARIPMYHARGSYASYRGPGITQVSHLIYPCPETHGTAHGFHSLGTHLTLDLQGNLRFGPDLEWLSPPSGIKFLDDEEFAHFWIRYLVSDGSRIDDMHKAVRSYLPGVTLDGFQPDHVGIRRDRSTASRISYSDRTIHLRINTIQ